MGNRSSSTATVSGVPSRPPEVGKGTPGPASRALPQPVAESSTRMHSRTSSGWSHIYRKALILHDLAYRERTSVARSAPQQNPRNRNWSRSESSLAELHPKAQSVAAPDRGNRPNLGFTGPGESNDRLRIFNDLFIPSAPAPQGESRGTCQELSAQ